MLRAASIALGLALAGCACTTRQKAAEHAAVLQAQSFERAVPAMRAAGASVGAQLLPLRAQVLYLPPCQPGEPHDVSRGCVIGQAANGRAFRFLDERGKTKLAIRTRWEAHRYARLARRGDTFVLLDPEVSRRVVGEGTQCECDAGLIVFPDFQYFAFVTDDLPDVEVLALKVPMQEDVIEWECKVFLL
jgi:hypothetical protein